MKIGKRGWLGVVLFAIGLLTFFGAHNQAESEQSGDGLDESAYENAVAKEAGYNSFTDALTEKNRNSGILFVCVGSALFAWGCRKYGQRKLADQNSQAQARKTDKPTN